MKEKDFDGWIQIKKKLHLVGRVRSVNVGDVWWYAAGENVRTEINGKSKRFSRPVIIIKKFGRFSFWGVPLTSQKHEGSWYMSFVFQNKTETAALHQLRNVDVSRLYDKMGQVPSSDLAKIIDGVTKLLFEK